jgi:hypothetical protein
MTSITQEAKESILAIQVDAALATGGTTTSEERSY